MAPDEVTQPRLLFLVGECTSWATSAIGIKATVQPRSQMEVDEMAAQIKPRKVSVIAQTTLGEPLVLQDLTLAFLADSIYG